MASGVNAADKSPATQKTIRVFSMPARSLSSQARHQDLSGDEPVLGRQGAQQVQPREETRLRRRVALGPIHGAGTALLQALPFPAVEIHEIIPFRPGYGTHLLGAAGLAHPLPQ